VLRSRHRAPIATHSLTTTEAAVLALLAIEGEQSGYDLVKQVDQAIGYVWAPAKTQLYVVLPRLAKRDLARSRTVRHAGRPEKQLYRITREGRRRLDAWLRVEPESVETFYLRLFVGGLVPDDVLAEHVEWFRRTVEARLDEYRHIEPTNTRTGNDFYHHLMLRLGIERSEQMLEWADWVRDQLRSRADR
jgi:DNA-binding PadR family transcriptional regulator